ncbi:hypothetical protein E2C01_021741 [Portunus trituberculatus]|uniref:Uncharacterized protein n=1 Tax=Portunus trituberculatus TaxID=210409 RepID=A0A5B7E5I7_PORTR|nr:hypothetical protein [Portunus trituberculatus]
MLPLQDPQKVEKKIEFYPDIEEVILKQYLEASRQCVDGSSRATRRALWAPRLPCRTLTRPQSSGQRRTGHLHVPSRIPQSEGASSILPLPDGGNLRKYYADFPWNDYNFHVRDPSRCAEHITEVIVSGMEGHDTLVVRGMYQAVTQSTPLPSLTPLPTQ